MSAMPASGPLAGLKILDLTRILAGPFCTQIFGDLGADVIKVEKPGAGDDTRAWGPPYVKDAAGADTSESAYYLSANRNKRSLALDIARPEGQAVIKRLLKTSDVLIHNFKTGGLEKYGLGYEDLRAEFPALVYCAITGFGQTGPRAAQPGYDLLAQAMGGMMSITGPADGAPHKAGVAIADICTGLYAAAAVLAALRHRDVSGGQGQFIDLSLLDVQTACLANVGLNYLTGGARPKRHGNAHPSIAPYEVCEAADGHIVLAVGNNGQFRRFCEAAGLAELADDPRFSENSSRVANHGELTARINAATRTRPRAEWINLCAAAGVPCGPVNAVDEAFADPQILARGMRVTMPHPLAGGGTVDVTGSPVKMSETPAEYRLAPPTAGQNTQEILKDLGLAPEDIEALKAEGVIG